MLRLGVLELLWWRMMIIWDGYDDELILLVLYFISFQGPHSIYWFIFAISF